MNVDTKEVDTAKNKANTTVSYQDGLIKQAYAMYMEKEARKLSLKAPHKDKVKKTNRTKNKVARASRRGNR